MNKNLLLAVLLLSTTSCFAQSTLSSNRLESNYWNGTKWLLFSTKEIDITFTVQRDIIMVNDDNKTVYKLIGMLEDSKEKAVYDALNDRNRECTVAISNTLGVCTNVSVFLGKWWFSYRIYKTNL